MRIIRNGVLLSVMALMLTAGGALAVHAQVPGDTHADQILYGNPKCGGTTFSTSGSITGVTVTINGNGTVTITVATGYEIGNVFVKGGTATAIYWGPFGAGTYTFSTAVNPNNGKLYGVSHVEICGVDKK